MKPEKRPGDITIKVVPHGTGALRTLVIKHSWMKGAAPALALAVLVLAYMGWDYGQLRYWAPQINKLHQERALQEERLQELSQQAHELNQKAKKLDELEQEIYHLLHNVEPIEAEKEGDHRGGGSGWIIPAETEECKEDEDTSGESTGAVSCEQVETQLASVQDHLGSNEEGMGIARTALQERLDYQAARPQGWPAEGRITSTYGYRPHPISGTRKFHEGIDIAAPTGTPVVATASGQVVFSDSRGGYGLTVIIEHGFGYRTLYAHNSSLVVSSGDYVERGELIARMGSTGASTGPHLHYEVHLGDDHVDPARYLPRVINVKP